MSVPKLIKIKTKQDAIEALIILKDIKAILGAEIHLTGTLEEAREMCSLKEYYLKQKRLFDSWAIKQLK